MPADHRAQRPARRRLAGQQDGRACQAATSSRKPVLLRVEEQAGHGLGSTREQEDTELADRFAFLLQQFGTLSVRPPLA